MARLVVPPYHSGIERQEQRTWPVPGPEGVPEILSGFPGGPELLTTLAEGGVSHAFWQVPYVAGPPGDPAGGVPEAASASLASGRRALVLSPMIQNMKADAVRLEWLLGQGCVVRLSWGLGRGLRYENYLTCLYGRAKVAVGTRPTVFVPLPNPGLTVVADDGNEGHCFERFSRPHACLVAMVRAVQDSCVLLLASHARSCEVRGLIGRQWFQELALPPREMRHIGPALWPIPEAQQSNPGGTRPRFPRQAFEHLWIRLVSGSVLVSAARTGRSPGFRCAWCRARTTCPWCGGPLPRPSRGQLFCRLCRHTSVRLECTRCHTTGLRTLAASSERTAEKLRGAFPGMRVINSSARRICSGIPKEPAIVVTASGGESRVPDGYAGALILDVELALSHANLRVGEGTLHHWRQVACLVRPTADGGGLLIVGSPEEPAVQALLRADLGGLAARELVDHAVVGLPLATKAIQVGGDPDAVAAFLNNDSFTGVEMSGSTLTWGNPDPEVMPLLRYSLEGGCELMRAVKRAATIRSTHKEGDRLFLQVDPMTLT